MKEQAYVWIFVGQDGAPGAVFSDVAIAETWIAKWSLTGVLTRYPLDKGAYDWAVEQQLFKPKKDEHRTGRFVGSFVSASMEHNHYENGILQT